YIKIVKPVADFSFSSVCKVSDSVSFLSSINGISPLMYQWDFGDGNTSIQPHPKHRYTTAGNYNATLIVTDSVGCKDTVTKSVNVSAFKADFTNTLPTCVNTVITFTNSSLLGGAYSWSFGDGAISTAFSPTHIYSNPGIYQVRLIATNTSNTCSDTI